MHIPSNSANWDHRRAMESLSAGDLANLQLGKLNNLLQIILPQNRFYGQHFAELKLPIRSLSQLRELPFTFKDQLVNEINSHPFAANLTYPPKEYSRFHRTSGTRGKPLAVLDTSNDWQWWIDTWQFVLDSAAIEPEDRIVFAFSFGPFIGFWSAFEASTARGAMCIPSGGMSTLSRLELIQSTAANVLYCTPSYAMHMAEVAAENQIDVARLPIDRIVVAGEPGGSIPAIRQRIESVWQARVIDHGGATEVGPWGFADPAGTGLHIIESEFIAEFMALESGQPAIAGQLSELVLTSLGRYGSPVIRYRTGDLARPVWNVGQPCQFVFLQGGILGRTDDMMIIRGINIFPSAIEQILHGFPEIVEYRITAFRQGHLDQLRIEIEDRLNDSQRVAKELQIRLGLRIEVTSVPLGSLPRFDLKGKRFIDNRSSG